jgi:hypothetical protein
MAFGCGMILYLGEQALADSFVEVARAKEGHRFSELAFSPDSTRLAVKLDDALLVYSIAR